MESLDQETPEKQSIPVAGRPDSGEADQLIHALTRFRGRLVRAGSQLIRWLGIDEADLDGESAVDLAFFELWQTEARCGDRAFWKEDAFTNRAWGMVRRVIFRQKQRSRSVRSGGEGRATSTRSSVRSPGAEKIGTVHRRPRRIIADLDQSVSRESPVEDVVDARLDLEALLQRLDDDVLRTVLIMRHQRSSITEIAEVLHLDRKTVARKLKKIAATYRKAKART